MAGRYTAQRPSLFGNVGGPQAPSSGFDGPGTVDAITNLAGSLIRQAYLRKQTERAQQVQDAQMARQGERDKIEDDRWNQEHALKREDLARRTEADRRKWQAEGGVPGSEGGMTATIEPVQAKPLTTIQQAMTRGMTAGKESTSPLAKPVDIGSVPKVTYGRDEATPDSYDPTRGAAYVRSTETARIRGEVAGELEDQRATNRSQLQTQRLKFMRETSVQLANIRAKAKGSGGGAIPRAMTANAREKAASEAALGLIDQTQGSYDEAETLLNSEAGKQFREFGITPRHLVSARAKYVQAGMKSAFTLQGGATGMSADSAVARVEQTRRMIGGGARQGKLPGAKSPAPGPDQSAFTAEAEKYKKAVANIEAKFTGTEREERLKRASQIYNERVAGVAGVKP